MRVPGFLGISLLSCLSLFLVACGGASGGVQQSQNASGNGGGSITQINHVVIMMQENRSFDDYFGQMTAYRQANNIPIVSGDGKINDLSTGSYSNLSPVAGAIPSYHSGSVCTDDLTPDWAESHKEMNLQNSAAAGPGAPMDGFVATAYGISQYALSLGITLADQTGHRAMGYYNGDDLNYYYFMASNFAMSDAFFSPVPSRTAVNRLFIHAATSQGHAHDPTSQLTAKTIWQELDKAGLTWKIYITDYPSPGFTYLQFFTYYSASGTSAHIFPLTQYFTDVQNGTLPNVAFIETGQFSGRDEHPSNFDPSTGAIDHIDVQVGANFVSGIINALMNSSSWKDSAFFWFMDEGGGLFDHVPPMAEVTPDSFATPVDLTSSDPAGNFTISGFRVPNFIVSPFARKNYVSHTPMDYTAILKFIETRWNLSNLTARDAAMPPMTEFFDFANPPWMTPPSPPAQNTNGVCDFTKE